MLASTLIKGGDISNFETRNKWIINPNMVLADNEEMLLRALTFLPEDKLVKEDMMTQLYKIWRPAFNKKLKDDVKLLDRIVMSAFIKIVPSLHSNFTQALSSKSISDALRTFLDNLLKIRNNFIHAQRDEQNKASLTQNIMTTARMLLNLDEDFSSFLPNQDTNNLSHRSLSSIDNSSLSDLSTLDRPDSIIQFITNQKVRINLTSIGFSLLNTIYNQSLFSFLLYNIIDIALNTVENFDTLAPIISSQHSTSQHHTFITKFMELGIRRNDDKLIIVSYKILKSGVLSPDETGVFLENIFNTLIELPNNPYLFRPLLKLYSFHSQCPKQTFFQ